MLLQFAFISWTFILFMINFCIPPVVFRKVDCLDLRANNYFFFFFF